MSAVELYCTQSRRKAARSKLGQRGGPGGTMSIRPQPDEEGQYVHLPPRRHGLCYLTVTFTVVFFARSDFGSLTSSIPSW